MTDKPPSDPAIPIYRPSPASLPACLYQGEILTDLIRLVLDLASIEDPSPRFIPTRHPFALVVSQACDLDWDFKSRHGAVASDKLVPSVMFCEAYLASELRWDKTRNINSTSWNLIRNNKDSRYQFLQVVPPSQDSLGEGIGELCLDFKRFFTVPTAEIYRRIELGQLRRRAVLESPYAEHLSDRFVHFLGRVGLPRDHESEKAP